MIIQEHDFITFGVDTANCWGNKNMEKFRYYNKKTQKVNKFGLDMVFLSGMDECIDHMKQVLPKLINKKNRINIEELKQYLKKVYPKEKSKWADYELNDIGITIMSIVNNESIIYSFSQTNDYEPFINKTPKNQVNLFVEGFDNTRIHEYAMKYVKGLNKALYRSYETFYTVYQNNYSEGVGGYIQVYSMDFDGCNLIKESKLQEKNLKYAIPQNEIDTVNLDELKPSKIEICLPIFKSNITASQIRGGTIEGTTFYSDNPLNAQETKIEGGMITTNSLVCEGGLGNNFMVQGNYLQMWHPQYQEMFHLDGMGNMMCKTLNIGGYTPITSANIPPIPNSTNDLYADLTSYGNIDFGNGSTENGAAVNWVQANFQPLGASDFRLKKNIRNLDELPDSLYMSLKPKLFEFKCQPYKQGSSIIGLLAQEVVSAFKNYSLDAFQYGLVEYFDAKKYTDECMYTLDGKLLRINYELFTTWGIQINQKLYKANKELTDRIIELETKFNLILESVGK